MLGDVVFTNGAGRECRLKPLSVRQVCTMQRLLAHRKAKDCADDCKALGIPQAEAMERTAKVREQAMLTSWLIRWCFEMDGACAVISESCGDQQIDAVCEAMTPDQLTDVALQLIGFEWEPSSGKWVSRAEAKSGQGIGS